MKKPTPFDRAKRLYSVLIGHMINQELCDHHFAIIKAEIEDAVMQERIDCQNLAEYYYRSSTELWHGEITDSQRVIGSDIARLIRSRKDP